MDREEVSEVEVVVDETLSVNVDDDDESCPSWFNHHVGVERTAGSAMSRSEGTRLSLMIRFKE